MRPPRSRSQSGADPGGAGMTDGLKRRRRGPARRSRPRDEEGWPPTPLDLELRGNNSASLNTFDRLGNPVTMAVRGKPMWIAEQEIVRYNVELGDKVKSWKNKKEISGKDVMEILGLALMLTNDPAYAAARKAMIRHRLDTGGLKRAFSNLHRRHHEPPERSCTEDISWYLKEGYSLTEAAEHVVADHGIPGTTFSSTVDKVRKAYAKRK
jgi:hypothetical protein